MLLLDKNNSNNCNSILYKEKKQSVELFQLHPD